MNHFNKYRRNILVLIIVVATLPAIISAAAFIIIYRQTDDLVVSVCFFALLMSILTYTACIVLLSSVIKPIDAIWKAIWHVSPEKSEVPPPNIDKIRIGRSMVNAIVMQIYDLASTNKTLEVSKSNDNNAAHAIIEVAPIALMIFNKNNQLKLANQASANLANNEVNNMLGRSIHEILDFSFDNENTLDKWLDETITNKVTDETHWHNVKLGNTKRVDLVARYSKNDSNDNELIIVMNEKTDYYSTQEESIGYISMAVHELRTPLTMLRGYIELFEEEIADQLDDEHRSFMHKMSATTQNLNAIVSNILNIARINENQFNLQLSEENWDNILREIVDSMELRAKVRQKHIVVDIAPDLPSAGVDKISIYEVVVNLIDNAIKYSGQSDTITVISMLADDGNIKTIIKDRGPGIPANVVGGLFTKFYRSHRSKDTVGGNGLGLYIVKSIITAHGGQVWVKSKEGQGSEFGFTVIPYANLEEATANGQRTIVRQASGWIKNHSLYRR